MLSLGLSLTSIPLLRKSVPFTGNYIDFDTADASGAVTATCGRNLLIGFTDADATGTFTSSLVPMQVIGLSDAVATCEFTATCDAGQLIAFNDADASGAFTASCTGESIAGAAEVGGLEFILSESDFMEMDARTFHSGKTVTSNRVSYDRYTFATWFKFRSASNPASNRVVGLHGAQNAGNSTTFGLSENSDGTVQARMRFLDGGFSVVCQTNNQIMSSRDTDLHFLAWEFDRTLYSDSVAMKVYFDSATALGENSTTADLQFEAAVSSKVYLGKESASDRYADIILVNPCVFDGVAAPISSLYNGGVPPAASAIAALTGCRSVISALSTVVDDEVIATDWTNSGVTLAVL